MTTIRKKTEEETVGEQERVNVHNGDTTEKNVTEVEIDSPLTNVNGNGRDESFPISKRQAKESEANVGDDVKGGVEAEEKDDSGHSNGDGSAVDGKCAVLNIDHAGTIPCSIKVEDVESNDTQHENGQTNYEEKPKSEFEIKQKANSFEGTAEPKLKEENDSKQEEDSKNLKDCESNSKVDKDQVDGNEEDQGESNETDAANDNQKKAVESGLKQISPLAKIVRQVDYDKLYPPDDHLLPPSDKPVHTPSPSDVLFGRGGLTNHHLGNKKFRQLVADHKQDYTNATKVVKPRVARKVVKMIRNSNPPGRFLKKKVGFWFDVGDRHAAEKTSQALREKSQDEKRENRKRQIEALLPGRQQYSASGSGKRVVGKEGKVDEKDVSIPSPSKSAVPELPPPYPPGFMVTPYAYYPMHAYAPGYPPPPHYYGTHPQPTPSVHERIEGEKEFRKNSSSNSPQDGHNNGSQMDSPDAKSQGQSIRVYEDPSFSSTLQPNYPTEGGIFGELDANGDIVVTDRDILCGRGGATNHHKGNKRFRDIVALHRQDYVSAPKVKKPQVAKLIVKAIRSSDPPGRFLKSNDEGKWFDIGDKKAAEKSSQALREKPTVSQKAKASVISSEHPAPIYLHTYAPGHHPPPPPMGYYAYQVMPGQPYNPAMGEGQSPSKAFGLTPEAKSAKESSPSKKEDGITDWNEESDERKRKSFEGDNENEEASKKHKCTDDSETKVALV